MIRKILLILITLSTLLTMSCNTNTSRFVVASYSSDNYSDISLFTVSGEGNAILTSEKKTGNNPSYFTRGKDGLLYFVNEVSSFNGTDGGGITTLRVTELGIEPVDGATLNQGGGGPCFVTLSDDQGYLLTANYVSGSVSVIKISTNGLPEMVTDTVFFAHPDSLQSHPHMVLFNPDKEVYYVTDLGMDKVYIFTLDIKTGKLIPSDLPFFDVEKGSGPRHMVMDEEFENLYISNELNSTVSVFNISDDKPVFVQCINALPDAFTGESFCGDICLSPYGDFLYVTNRGNNTIGVFSVEDDGTLSVAGHVSCGGDWPRNMAIDRNGENMIICNQRSGDIAFFHINPKRGIPEIKGYPYKLNAPSCVKFIE